MVTHTRTFTGHHGHSRRAPSGLFRPVPSSIPIVVSEDEASTVESDSDAYEWSPRADLFETESAYHVDLDLPGVDQRLLQITLGDGVLTISGERALHEGHIDGRFHSLERQGGRFSRSFWLGQEVDFETVDATFGNGVLHVAVRKAHVSTLRRIEVRIEP